MEGGVMDTSGPLSPHDLRSARHQLGMSQPQLAGTLGVSVDTLRRWERGEVPITYRPMLRLALLQLGWTVVQLR